MPRGIRTNLYYDPEEVKQLRGELLRAGLAIMQDKAEVKKWSAYKKEYVLKVGSRVLPVLNAGRDDDKDLIPYARNKEEQIAIEKALNDLNG